MTPRLAKLLFALTVVVLLALAVSGCAGWRAETVVEEGVYQGVHAVDGLQTLQIARHPHDFHEVGASGFIGDHPSEAGVAAWYAGFAVLHLAVTEELEAERVPMPVVRIWEGLMIVPTVVTVGHNFAIGIGVTKAAPR